MLALLVLHRAKLLASNQSILALGRSPRTGRQPFVPPHLCIDSHLCRCIVQRLCVAVFMHPCITALCDRYRASLLKTLGVHFIRHPCPFLVKGEVLSPTKIRATTGGDATPSALAPHQPFQNRTIPRHAPPHLAPLPKGAGLRQGYFLS